MDDMEDRQELRKFPGAVYRLASKQETMLRNEDKQQPLHYRDALRQKLSFGAPAKRCCAPIRQPAINVHAAGGAGQIAIFGALAGQARRNITSHTVGLDAVNCHREGFVQIC